MVRNKVSGFLAVLAAAIILASCQTTTPPPAKIGPITSPKIGVLLLHAKAGRPDKFIETLHLELSGAGVLVEAPLMPWGEGRIYEKGYEESMVEMDASVEKLKSRGAKRIVIAGHSLGANVALGCAARRKGLAGVVVMAYGHPVDIFGFQMRLVDSVVKAENMIAAGKGEQIANFDDVILGSSFSVSGTANDILSWFDPMGPAHGESNAGRVSRKTPVLCVDESNPPSAKHGCNYIMNAVWPNPLMRTVKVGAGHTETPTAATPFVLDWLAKLE